jgi:putative oxidoreductase
MKKITSTSYSEWAFNLAMLLIRLGAGSMIMMAGYNKLIHFADMKNKFINFMGLGVTTSLCLVIFAEFFCAIFLMLGFLSRLAAIPLIINMSVALFMAHGG